MGHFMENFIQKNIKWLELLIFTSPIDISKNIDREKFKKLKWSFHFKSGLMEFI